MRGLDHPKGDCHADPDPISLQRGHERPAGQGSALQRGVRQGTRAVASRSAGRHRGRAFQERAGNDDDRRGAQDDRDRSEPAYNALYEGESPAVLTSDAWAKAVEEGRWAEHVRPYTTNRRHVMYHRIS